MKAVILKEFGPVENFEISMPKPGLREVFWQNWNRHGTHAIGVNR